MPEQKSTSKPVEAATAGPGEKRAASRPPQLGRASESGDPAVQKALGDLNTAEQNLAAGEPAEQAVKDARARLAELGFE